MAADNGNFMQQFHELASVEDEVRCRAAHAITKMLQSGSLGQDEVPYTVRRLVRGVQSSRQFCRQGFSLALAELLHAMPDQAVTVLQVLDKASELQSGLRANEQKERLLAKCFVYGAVVQAGCLRKAGDDLISRLSRGLWDLHKARSYLSSCCMCLLKEICDELCAAGHHARVAEVIAPWKLDEAVANGFDTMEPLVLGLLLHLRHAYEAAEKKPQSWPSCVQKDVIQRHSAVVARKVGEALSSCAIGDAVPELLADFCRWWLTPSKGRAQKHEEIWGALEEGLFPESQTSSGAAQAFRGMAELARCLSQSQAECVVSLFKNMKRGWEQLFYCVASKHQSGHTAACFAHSILVELVGGQRETQHLRKGKKRKLGQENESPCQLELPDDTRLAILSSLQEMKAYQRVPANLKKQWQQALLAPLSPHGVRLRCGEIISSIAQGTAPPMRVVAAQLEQLAVHSKVPDEAVLAIVFQFFLFGYIVSSGRSVRFSLQSFKKSVGLPEAPAEWEDVQLTVQHVEEEERTQWRQKLWSTCAQLVRRTWPEAAEKLITGEDFSAAEVFSGGEEGPGSMVRSLAFAGCLSDGTLLAFRLLQWWDHVVSEKASKKAPVCSCIVELEEADAALHNRVLKTCQSIMALEEGKNRLSARQKNAVCSLPLSISLVMLHESLENAQEVLSELLKILDAVAHVVETEAKPKKKLAEALAGIAPIAAELYVADAPAMIREACKMTWRELAFYAADETVQSLCLSVCGAPAGEEEAEEQDEDEEDDAEDDDPSGAKKAVFDKAIAAMKEKNEAKAAEDEEEDDVTTLDHSGVLSELLDDGAGELMNSFAASRLDGATNQRKRKLTKRQQKLRSRQDEFIQRLREAELLESFLMRSGSRRPVCLELIEKLQVALVDLKHKVKLHKEVGQEEGDDKQNKQSKQSKADTTLRSLEDDLSQRVQKMLQRLSKSSCRPAYLEIIAGWLSPDEWATKARASCAQVSSARFCRSHPQVLEVCATHFYFLCAAHRAASQESEVELGEGWTLAEELLAQLLQEWAGKKECDNWCQAALKSFAVRAPQVLLKLPWKKTVKGAHKAFAQRSQLIFLYTYLLRPLPPETTKKADVAKQMSFADGCEKLCNELMESVGSEEATETKQQKQKLRREARQAIKTIQKLRQRDASRKSLKSRA